MVISVVFVLDRYISSHEQIIIVEVKPYFKAIHLKNNRSKYGLRWYTY